MANKKRNKPYGYFITKEVLKKKIEDPEKYLTDLGITSIIIGERGNKWRLYAWHFKTRANELISQEGFKFCSTGQMP